MQLQRKIKTSPEFSMSSMTDMMFLLLIFFMISSTMMSPNALDVTLPQSSAQTETTPYTTVTITEDLVFAVETQIVEPEQIEQVLREKIGNKPNPVVALHADKRVPVEQVVKVMNIARNNHYRLVLATQP